MVFLDGPRKAAGRRHNLLQAATCAALLLIGAVVLPGCGGGGGDDGVITPPAVTTATVRGRVVESTTNQNVAGIVIRFGDATATTNANGEFSFVVPGGGDARSLTLELPAGQYFATGRYGTSACVSLSGGITVAKTDLENGDTINLGDIGVYNVVTSPPPPPCNF